MISLELFNVRRDLIAKRNATKIPEQKERINLLLEMLQNGIAGPALERQMRLVAAGSH